MQLFIIPIFLSIGVFLLSRSERNNEREIATDRQLEAALQTYLDRMADLLLKGELLTTKSEDVRNVARIRTLTVLRGLDRTRKGVVLRFLQEAELISKENTIVNLAGADLHNANLAGTNLPSADPQRANLQRADWEFYDGLLKPTDVKRGLNLHGLNLPGANLKDVNLKGADLESANLRDAVLYGADLRHANLKHADLRGANLRFANLQFANLQGAFLTEADLKGADLESANLKDVVLFDAYLKQANLRHANLKGAKQEGATMPDRIDFTKLSFQAALSYHVMTKFEERDRAAKLQADKLAAATLLAETRRVYMLQGAQQEGATMPDDTKDE
jgi:uncharacterized protein YjbI with pentapeptide repeats